MWVRILAVGTIIGFAGMAVAALARDPAPAPIVEYPVAERAKKTDRLSLVPEHRTVDTTTSTPAVQSAPIDTASTSPANENDPWSIRPLSSLHVGIERPIRI